MSELGDKVREALTPEWQTTVEIAAKVEPSRGVDGPTHAREVYKHLHGALPYGGIERRVGPSPSGGRVAYWRLRRCPTTGSTTA
jgi:hypothetical protein